MSRFLSTCNMCMWGFSHCNIFNEKFLLTAKISAPLNTALPHVLLTITTTTRMRGLYTWLYYI